MTQPAGARWSRILGGGRAQIELSDGGQVWLLDLPVRPTREWAAALAEGDLEAIVPELLEPASRDLLIEVIRDGRLGERMHSRMVNAVVAEASGRPWMVAVRLLNWTERNWADFHGYCLLHGLPEPLALPLDAYCDVVWHVLMANQDDKGRAKLEFEFSKPVPGADDEDDEAWAGLERDSFMQAMGNLSAVRGRRAT